MKIYSPYTSRIFYLTGKEKDFIFFGGYHSKISAKIIAKLFAIIRDIFTKGEWDGVAYGVIIK